MNSKFDQTPTKICQIIVKRVLGFFSFIFTNFEFVIIVHIQPAAGLF